MSKSGKDSESAEARRKREASLEPPRVEVLDSSQTASQNASLEEDQPPSQDNAPPANSPRRPSPYKISFDNVDANRVAALKDETVQKIKYQKQKVSVGICIFLGLFFFIGLPIYLVGLLVYNKISEWKFNKAQAIELSQAEAGLREHEVQQRAATPEGTEVEESSKVYSIYSDSKLTRKAPSKAEEETKEATEAAEPAQPAQAAAESEDDDTQEDNAEDSQEESHSASHSDTPLVKK